jgi:DNA-binding response OmpR family regulator
VSTVRVLVVDDQREILELTETVLSSEGLAVETASSGDEALRKLARGTFDLVLLDINMPAMDGWETLRLIRTDERHEDLPVVMFSVKGEVADQVQSLQAGATAYITKPFVVDELVGRLRRVLARRRGGRSEPPAREA